jgi:glycopeptide antibiotics resistance protein
MDIYQILITHNRPWSFREILAFMILFFITSVVLLCLYKAGKIKITQLIVAELLFLFLSVVFASTVFTRTPGIRQYELIPFWSWYEVFVNHSKELLWENILNVLLLFPMGILLKPLFGHKMRPFTAFLLGFTVSAVIEISQLVLRRGLFEWDDMLHNGLGCMLGFMLCSKLWKYTRR